jgi:hypothetical protein
MNIEYTKARANVTVVTNVSVADTLIILIVMAAIIRSTTGALGLRAKTSDWSRWEARLQRPYAI